MKLNRTLRRIIRATILTLRDILVMCGLALVLILVVTLVNSIFGQLGILMNFVVVGILIMASVFFVVNFNELNKR